MKPKIGLYFSLRAFSPPLHQPFRRIQGFLLIRDLIIRRWQNFPQNMFPLRIIVTGLISREKLKLDAVAVCIYDDDCTKHWSGPSCERRLLHSVN